MMKIFGINFTTKRRLRAEIETWKDIAEYEQSTKKEVIKYNNQITAAYEDMKKVFPFNLGDVVYDIQLRGENGRYTKTKASKAQSVINEVVVDKKNYFKLADRLGTDVFTSREAAEEYLDEVCVK